MTDTEAVFGGTVTEEETKVGKWRYKRDSKGRIRQWCAYNEGPYYVSISGLSGGAMKTTRNLQKASKMLTAESVALSKMVSQYKSKEKDGYFETEEEAKAYVPTKPMLLHRYDKSYDKIKFPALLMPKLDGVCATFMTGGAWPKLMSREDNEFEKLRFMADNIWNELKGKGCEIVNGHGELYAHGHVVSEIVEAIKGDNVEVLEKLKLYTFDYMPHLNLDSYVYSARLTIGQKLWKWAEPGPYWEPIRILVANSHDDVKRGTDNFIAQGFEGSVVANLMGKYEYDTRSYDKLKVKKLFSEEFKICGYEAEYDGDTPMIVFECEAKNGTRFMVRPAWGNPRRAKGFSERTEYIDKALTVEYRSLTKYGVPFHPVGKAVRDYE